MNATATTIGDVGGGDDCGNGALKRGSVATDTFSGAYLDNGLGCFVAAEVARLVAEDGGLGTNIRLLSAFASHEEIGRFGSRVLAAQFMPDVLIAVDGQQTFFASISKIEDFFVNVPEYDTVRQW